MLREYIQLDVKSPIFNTFKFHLGNHFPSTRKLIVLPILSNRNNADVKIFSSLWQE